MRKRINRPIEALYIHIPFCQHICDYCDFPKLQYFRIFAEKYLLSLEKELLSYQINEGIKTIYVGGGTPTSLDDDLFLKLLEIIKPYTEQVEEYTFEANPESLTMSKLKMMKEFKVNRLSIGVETTNDEILKKINRHHTYQDVVLAINTARKMGFDNINVDLIIGLPSVQKEQFMKDLDNVVSLNVDHISCYSLTIHPHTVFGIKGYQEPEEEKARDFYDSAESFLKEKGYIHYEVSNWAKNGKESQHNLTYWKDEHYYGIGLGASGYVNETRYTNTRNLKKYQKGEFIEEKEQVTRDDDKLYFLMLNLRTRYGINFEKYRLRFKEDFYPKHQNTISRLVKDGFLSQDENGIYPTYDGMMVLDQLIMELGEEDGDCLVK